MSVLKLLVRFKLRFANPEAEKAFLQDYRTASRRQAFVAAAFGAFAFTGFGLWDMTAYEPQFANSLLVIRFGFIVPAFLLVMIACKVKGLSKHMFSLITAASLASGLGIVAQIHILPNEVRVNDVSGLVLVIVFIYSNSRLRTLPAACVGAAILLGYLIETNFLTYMSNLDRIMGGLMVSVANVLGVFVGYNLERSIRSEWKKSQRLDLERRKTEDLLLRTLPPSIAARLKDGYDRLIADSFDEATVLFADLVGFTAISEKVAAKDIVLSLNDLYSRFDFLTEKHGLEKIKTIGDAYMAVGGVPQPRADHAEAIIRLALDMMIETKHFSIGGYSIKLRIGIQSGPVVAGVIGQKRLLYDLWGDTVNTASRMESHSLPGEIHIAESTYLLVKDKFLFVPREPIIIKGKGRMNTYLILQEVGPSQSLDLLNSA